MSRPTVSIAMATYNGERYLGRQLHSFTQQTHVPDELVICDDGSEDSTIHIVEAFASTSKFDVRLVRNAKRMGYNENFEQSVRLCTKDIIFISDQDDEWFPTKITEVVAQFQKDKSAYIVTNDQIIVNSVGRSCGITVLDNIRKLGYPDSLFGPGCCTAIRRPILDLLLPFPEPVPYDYWINTIPDLLGARILLSVPLQTYRRHGANTSASRFASTSFMANIAHSMALDSRSSFDRRIQTLDSAINNLRRRSSAVHRLNLRPKLQFAIDALLSEKHDYEARLACLSQRRLRRLPLIFNLLRSGTYSRFRGLKTAAKDLISR
jgi:glycosyltransferase involved in cell wall biosynthesis